jgi:hypothetical protein
MYYTLHYEESYSQYSLTKELFMPNNKSVGKKVPPVNLTSLLVQTVTDAPEDVILTVEGLRNELLALGRTGADMLQQPARIAGVLKHAQDLHNNLSGEEFTQLTDAAGVLVKDLKRYRDDLDKLQAEGEAFNWAAGDILDLQQPTLFLYEKYQEWILSFTNVVMPISAAIDNLIKVAAANQKKKAEEKNGDK